MSYDKKKKELRHALTLEASKVNPAAIKRMHEKINAQINKPK